MELVPLKPRRGEGTWRIDDSNDFVVIESVGAFPSNEFLTPMAYRKKYHHK